jgi:hypothetical protein
MFVLIQIDTYVEGPTLNLKCIRGQGIPAEYPLEEKYKVSQE